MAFLDAVLNFGMAFLPDEIGKVELNGGLGLWLRCWRHAVERPPELGTKGVQERDVVTIRLPHFAKRLVSGLGPQVRL